MVVTWYYELSLLIVEGPHVSHMRRYCPAYWSSRAIPRFAFLSPPQRLICHCTSKPPRLAFPLHTAYGMNPESGFQTVNNASVSLLISLVRLTSQCDKKRCPAGFTRIKVAKLQCSAKYFVLKFNFVDLHSYETKNEF